MNTILAYTDEPCATCGCGKVIDQKKTCENATVFRGDVHKADVALCMGISQQYYGDLELGRRLWNGKLAKKFENAVRAMR